MLCRLTIQIFDAAECLLVKKVPLVVPMASFRFPIVPGYPRWNQLVCDRQRSQLHIKWTRFRFRNVYVSELCPIVCLNCLNLEGRRLYQHLKKYHRVLRRMLFKAIHKPHLCTFIAVQWCICLPSLNKWLPRQVYGTSYTSI